MALIGHLEQFNAFFAHYPALMEAKEYLTQALTPDSAVHKRIIALQSSVANERVEVSYELGGGIRAIEQTYPLKAHTEAFYESHRIFVDFQLCVAGMEYFEIGHITDFTPLADYDTLKDLIIYHNPKTPPHRLFFHSGILGVFFPEDVHAGGLRYDIESSTPTSVLNANPITPLLQPQKVVLKVPLELFHPKH
ncbi:YhcH/YjgK/YiaL family protein [uncultured Helicobacter sp.]|uniref:YhcH/YjgK/YiaL family protein n=1 Tax=uncultured Helicobacter sp. TaxID=175537 RepID=UPI00374E62E8